VVGDGSDVGLESHGFCAPRFKEDGRPTTVVYSFKAYRTRLLLARNGYSSITISSLLNTNGNYYCDDGRGLRVQIVTLIIRSCIDLIRGPQTDLSNFRATPLPTIALA
jgi:hypothetical protein